MRFKNLNDWLTWQESLNPKEIDLGLDRVSKVLKKAGLSNTFDCPLITVAGTNGKGSVVAILEAIAKAAGLKVCSYTSPHIFQYNERVKIDGLPVSDTELCEAFERLDQARGDTALTYFEFGTLAAIDLFFKQQPDLVILEVGLGGRLDAVNVMDADISILTSVAIDHVDWLGDNRESIGFEKAGIFRHGNTVVCGDKEPPTSVVEEARNKQCEFLLAGRDYKVITDLSNDSTDGWSFESGYGVISDLPQPNLLGEFQKHNAAMAFMAIQKLQSKGLGAFQFDLSGALKSALTEINLSGRFQQLRSDPEIFVDVAHNPQAALALSSQLSERQVKGKTWAIVAMLADKDIKGVLGNVATEIDVWCLSGLDEISRGLSVSGLLEQLPGELPNPEEPIMSEQNRHDLALNQCTMLTDTVLLTNTVEKACEWVLSKVDSSDRVIIFGSFYTIAEAMKKLSDIDS